MSNVIPCKDYGDQGIIPVDHNDCPRFIKFGAEFHCVSSDGKDVCKYYESDENCSECGCLKVYCIG